MKTRKQRNKTNTGQFPPERVQVVGRRKYRQRTIVPEFTSERDEGVKMLLNSCLRDLDGIGMSLVGKASAAREGGRQVQKSG